MICGREIFERALKDPESLTDSDPEVGENLQAGGIQYIAGKVAERLGSDLPDRGHPHRKEPAGKKSDEEAVARLYPKLARKYDFN